MLIWGVEMRKINILGILGLIILFSGLIIVVKENLISDRKFLVLWSLLIIIYVNVVDLWIFEDKK